TDEAGSSKVEYGLTSAYGLQTTETHTDPRVTEHSVTLNPLKVCARYFYRVISIDAHGNEAISDQKTFSTTGCETTTVIESGNENKISKDTGGNVNYTNGSTTV